MLCLKFIEADAFNLFIRYFSTYITVTFNNSISNIFSYNSNFFFKFSPKNLLGEHLFHFHIKKLNKVQALNIKFTFIDQVKLTLPILTEDFKTFSVLN